MQNIIRRKIIFYILLFCTPLLFIILTAGIAEVSARIFYEKKGNAAITGPNFHSNKLIWPLDRNKNILHPQHSLNTSITTKSGNVGPELIYESDLLDKNKGGVPLKMINGVLRPSENILTRSIVRVNKTNEILYDVEVNTDHLGRRITPSKDSKSKDNHIVFFGCSYVFGEGVEQEQTLPYYTAEATSSYKSYNLGVNGGSIADAWAYTHVLDQLQDISEKNGKAVYVFIDDHIYRYTGTMLNVAASIQYRPYLRVNDRNEIKYYGTWNLANPFLVNLSEFFSESYFLRKIGFNFTWVRTKDIENYVKIIGAVRKKYHEKFGVNNQFVVLLYFDAAKIFAKDLKFFLEQEGIDYLDYSTVNLNQLSNSNVYIQMFGHPNALANKLVGYSIAEDLKLQ